MMWIILNPYHRYFIFLSNYEDSDMLFFVDPFTQPVLLICRPSGPRLQ